MFQSLGIVAFTFYISKVFSDQNIGPQPTPLRVLVGKRENPPDPPSTVTISDTSPLNSTVSPTNGSPMPTGSDLLVQNTTDGIVVYFGDELQGALKQTIQSECDDLWNATCHAALQNQFRINQTESQQNTSSSVQPRKPQERRDVVEAGVVSNGVLAVSLAALINPALVPPVLAGFVLFFMAYEAYKYSKVPTEVCLRQEDIKQLSKDPNATAIEFANSKQKPLVVEEQGSDGDTPFILEEANGAYSIHMQPDLTSEINTLLSNNQTSTNDTRNDQNTDASSKRNDNRQAFTRRGAPTLTSVQAARVQHGVRVLTNQINSGGSLHKLAQIVQKSDKPIVQRVVGPLQNLLVEAFSQTPLNNIPGLDHSQPTNSISAQGMDLMRVVREVVFSIVAAWVLDGAIKGVTFIDNAWQDQSDQKYCPEQALLRCEAQGCLNSKGDKTDTETCPLDCQDKQLKGCKCTDCPAAEFMPFCDNCGGLLPGSDPDADKSKNPAVQGRDVPRHGKHARCVGYPDKGWQNCPCLVNTNPAPFSYFPDAKAWEEAQQALLNLPLLSSNETNSVTPTFHPYPPGKSPDSSPAPSKPSSCPNPAPAMTDAPDVYRAWLVDPKNSCNECVNDHIFQHCDWTTDDSKPVICECPDPSCQGARCVLKANLPPLKCPEDEPDFSKNPVQWDTWHDKSTNQCKMCPDGKYQGCSDENHPGKSFSICTCSVPGCDTKKCYE